MPKIQGVEIKSGSKMEKKKKLKGNSLYFIWDSHIFCTDLLERNCKMGCVALMQQKINWNSFSKHGLYIVKH